MARKKDSVEKDMVAEYLRAHPDFFQAHAELFEVMLPPEVKHGGNVVDLQTHMVGKLQNGIKSLKTKYEGLVTSSRDNMSILHQVHEAVLSIMRAAGLDQLLEIIAMDLPARFGVDVVRLVLESDAGEAYETQFTEENASGIAFMETGFIARAMGKEKNVLLIEDTAKQPLYGFEQIFVSCAGLVESAALLRMRLPSSQRFVMLAFGVRVKGHFYEGQGTELLSFFAQVVEHRLDECLNESGIAHLI